MKRRINPERGGGSRTRLPNITLMWTPFAHLTQGAAHNFVAAVASTAPRGGVLPRVQRCSLLAAAGIRGERKHRDPSSAANRTRWRRAKGIMAETVARDAPAAAGEAHDRRALTLPYDLEATHIPLLLGDRRTRRMVWFPTGTRPPRRELARWVFGLTATRSESRRGYISRAQPTGGCSATLRFFATAEKRARLLLSLHRQQSGARAGGSEVSTWTQPLLLAGSVLRSYFDTPILWTIEIRV